MKAYNDCSPSDYSLSLLKVSQLDVSSDVDKDLKQQCEREIRVVNVGAEK